MNVFQSHNVGVADPATERKRLLVEHCIPFIWKSSALSPPLFSSFFWTPIPYQSLPPLAKVFLEHTLLEAIYKAQMDRAPLMSPWRRADSKGKRQVWPPCRLNQAW